MMRFLHALAVSALVSSARANMVDCTEEPDKCKHADSCDTCGVHPGSEVSVENLEHIFFLFLLFPSSKKLVHFKVICPPQRPLGQTMHWKMEGATTGAVQCVYRGRLG